MVAIVSLVLAGFALVIQFWPWGPDLAPAHNKNAQLRPATPRGELWSEEKAVIALYSEARKSVVHIHTEALRQNRFNFDVFRVPRGTGSGFIWDKEGHVVTNYHVAVPEGENPKNVRLRVTLYDQTEYTASIVGAYPNKDTAVLVLNAPVDEVKKLRPIPIGTSDDLQVGQSAFAIGNPFGLDQTLTRGLISALGRTIQTKDDRPPIRNVIQTDAAINPGNSGGPLLDSAGRLIGINTAIYSPSGASAGIGFAIPVDEINRIVTQLIRAGRVPSMGIEPARDEWSRRVHNKGVLILSVDPKGPADRAGLRGVQPVVDGFIPGDVLLEVGGIPIQSAKEYYEAMEKQEVGKLVEVKILRDNRVQATKIQL